MNTFQNVKFMLQLLQTQNSEYSIKEMASIKKSYDASGILRHFGANHMNEFLHYKVNLRRKIVLLLFRSSTSSTVYMMFHVQKFHKANRNARY